MLDNREVKAILCGRGGYGMSRGQRGMVCGGDVDKSVGRIY